MTGSSSIVIATSAAMQQTALAYRAVGRRIGVVPTMGALHEGHLALIRRARELADIVVTTIFVNPLQFGKAEDLSRYPRGLDKDVERATAAGTDLIFAPGDGDIYQAGFSTYVEVEGITEPLEGRSRPGHFRGVTTIVAKLFLITQPHVAVFGQKDAQQVIVVGKMVRDLNFPVELVIVPTVREPNGLALSSRNAYLSPAQRSEAPVLYQALQHGERLLQDGERDCSRVRETMRDLITSRTSGTIDYISIADGVTLQEVAEANPGRPLLISLAVRFGSTRLIDNTTITLREQRK
jgi:pantoate--beta-alanine ligase